jgi:hypothetical protein
LALSACLEFGFCLFEMFQLEWINVETVERNTIPGIRRRKHRVNTERQTIGVKLDRCEWE